MWFSAIATDYDGTLASQGVLSDKTISALMQVRQSGRFVILLTGRTLPDLQRVCPRFDLFDVISVENGALLHTPATKQNRLLCYPLDPIFLELLRDLNVTPITAGEVIVAMQAKSEPVVRHIIQERRLPLHVIRNKDSLMVLPEGIDKNTGLAAAKNELHIPEANVLGFGDAENDLTFLQRCGCSAAVANALPELRAQVDIVSPFENGDGVTEIVHKMLAGAL